MNIEVQFFSYFRDLTGCSRVIEELPEGATIDDLYRRLVDRFPRMASMQNSTLIAVGVEYQPRQYVLKPGDEVSMFPPVQGG